MIYNEKQINYYMALTVENEMPSRYSPEEIAQSTIE